MAIDVLVVDLIPANAIELFGNRAQANTNRSGEEFNYRTIRFDLRGSTTRTSIATLAGVWVRLRRNERENLSIQTK